jgi:hypothetical protein
MGWLIQAVSGSWGGRGRRVKPFGVCGVGRVEGDLPAGVDLLRGADVDRGRGVHPDPGMTVLVVVGGEVNRTGFDSGYFGWVAASVRRVWLGS